MAKTAKGTGKHLRVLLWAAGCVMLNFTVNATINKYGSNWSDAIIILLWLISIIPFVIWGFLHEKMLFSRALVRNVFNKHPVSFVLVCLLFSVIIIDRGYLAVYRFGHRLGPLTVVKIEPPARTEQQAPQRAEPPKIFQKTFPKIESPKPKSKQSTVHSIDITAFDSKAQLVCYNPGEKKVFLSHLSLRCDKLGFSSVTAIDGIVESEAYFVQKFASPTADASKFGTHVFTDSSWEKFLVRYGLRENECVLWHLFAANDPGYQTMKSFHAKHGAIFHSVPVNGTLVFRLGQEEIIQNVDVFAVPVINNTESCRAVLQE